MINRIPRSVLLRALTETEKNLLFECVSFSDKLSLYIKLERYECEPVILFTLKCNFLFYFFSITWSIAHHTPTLLIGR